MEAVTYARGCIGGTAIDKKAGEQQIKCCRDTEDGEETKLQSPGRDEGRECDSWKGWYLVLPFVPFAHNMALFS